MLSASCAISACEVFAKCMIVMLSVFYNFFLSKCFVHFFSISAKFVSIACKYLCYFTVV